ncbi:hypothetical protein K3495_g1771 [Podosphaera aphanis]|nr:hypothetical protein K3495_g1771 [Podosphaera aphanis]
MARLNEPPSSPDSIETIRRKFIRQNRDIARANSAQSLRIRNLENEISRLLTENLDFRQQILRLQNELQGLQDEREREQTLRLKDQLEAKLLEIGAIVSGLGRYSDADKVGERRKKPRSSSLFYNTNEIWKSRCSLEEAKDSHEERLPAILEDKSYPSNDEVLALITDAESATTESPEIGPPPISQFVDEDPVKIDLPRRVRETSAVEIMTLDPTLSTTVEQRRKRKDSLDTGESKKCNRIETTPKIDKTTDSLKAGAKRKFSVRDEYEDTTSRQTREHSPKERSPDDFKVCRTAEKENVDQSDIKVFIERSTRKTSREAAAMTEAMNKLVPNARVLAPKSVNNSPKKKLPKPNEDLGKLKKIPKEKSAQIVQILPTLKPELKAIEIQAVPVVQIDSHPSIEEEQPPQSITQQTKNHVDLENVSPQSQPGPRADASRPSRRARTSVNYVEPNLRHKMRRPTKELADAVITDKTCRKIKAEEEGCSENVVRQSPEPTLQGKSTDSTTPSRSKKCSDPNAAANLNLATSHRKRSGSITGDAVGNYAKDMEVVIQKHETCAKTPETPEGDTISSSSVRNPSIGAIPDPEPTSTNDRASRRRRTTTSQGKNSRRELEPDKNVRNSTNAVGLVLSGRRETSVDVSSRRSLTT